MKIPNGILRGLRAIVSLARIVSEDSQPRPVMKTNSLKSSKDS